MTYATQQDLIDRYGEARLVELSDRAVPPTNTIDAAVVDQALADAAAVIDSYVGGRYQTPVVPVPDVLRVHACVLAWSTLHVFTPDDKAVNDQRATIRHLEAIAAGRAQLPGAEVPSAPAEAEVVGPNRVVSRDTLCGL